MVQEKAIGALPGHPSKTLGKGIPIYLTSMLPISWGFNIHHRRMPAEQLPPALKQVAAGSRVVRDDFNWAAVEKVAGVYDFSNYDSLHEKLRNLHMRPYYILDYGNAALGCDFRGKAQQPHSKQCIQMFTQFAITAIKRYAARWRPEELPVIWELWNEPNTKAFWGGTSPYGNATEYASLAFSMRDAREASGLLNSSSHLLIGPAVAGFGTSNATWEFLDALSSTGALSTFDALSVHAYRSGPPEGVLDDYNRLRFLVGGRGASMPIISGEWGWTTCEASPNATNCPRACVADEGTQAKWLARQWLINTLAAVNVSIFYDYVEDCGDASDRECRFGVTRQPFLNNSIPHQPKPAFRTAVTLQQHLGGREFHGRLPTSSPFVYVLAFSGRHLAAWSTAAGGANSTSCAVADFEKMDCGYYGITRSQCFDRGCCFGPVDMAGPQCFVHAINYTRTASIAVDAVERNQCWLVVNLVHNESAKLACAVDGQLQLRVDDNVRVLIPQTHSNQ